MTFIRRILALLLVSVMVLLPLVACTTENVGEQGGTSSGEASNNEENLCKMLIMIREVITRIIP